jgi:hypothetical protein
MGLATPQARVRAVVVALLVLCGGVAAYALNAGATRASEGSSRPPSIHWLSPRDGSTVRGTLRGSTCDVAVHDTRPVTKVAFGLDGSLLTTATAAPYTCEVSAAGLSPGMHIFTARAYDTAGNSLSAYIYVSIPWNRRPRISVTVQGDSLSVGSWWRLPADLGPNYDFVSYSAHLGPTVG